jgi:hypothetical protein
MNKVDQELMDIRRAYLLAKALNTQYTFIREFVTPELRKAINEAKAKNSHFIKTLDDIFDKQRVPKSFLESEEEIAFEVLEQLEKKDVNKQNLPTSQSR